MILGHILCYEDYQNATMCIEVEEMEVMEVIEVMEVDMMGVMLEVVEVPMLTAVRQREREERRTSQ